MTIQDLKTILINNLRVDGKNSYLANKEIIDQVIKENSKREISLSEIYAFHIGDTLVFLSEAGLVTPNQVVFLDLISNESFLQELR